MPWDYKIEGVLLASTRLQPDFLFAWRDSKMFVWIVRLDSLNEQVFEMDFLIFFE